MVSPPLLLLSNSGGSLAIEKDINNRRHRWSVVTLFTKKIFDIWKRLNWAKEKSRLKKQHNNI